MGFRPCLPATPTSVLLNTRYSYDPTLSPCPAQQPVKPSSDHLIEHDDTRFCRKERVVACNANISAWMISLPTTCMMEGTASGVQCTFCDGVPDSA